MQCSSCASSIVADPTGVARGLALEVVQQRDVVALGGPGSEVDAARRAGSRVNDQAEGVGARQGHERRGAALVAARDDDHCLRVVRVVARLDAIGHQLARGEAVAGVGGALRQRVGYRRRPDQEALAAPLADNLDQQIRDTSDTVVATMGVGVGAGDGHDGVAFRRVRGIESGGAELHRAQAFPGVVPVAWARLGHGVPSSLNAGTSNRAPPCAHAAILTGETPSSGRCGIGLQQARHPGERRDPGEAPIEAGFRLSPE